MRVGRSSVSVIKSPLNGGDLITGTKGKLGAAAGLALRLLSLTSADSYRDLDWDRHFRTET